MGTYGRHWIKPIPYAEAAHFCRLHHTHLPEPPPRVQVVQCFAAGGRHTHAVVMIGQPVAPAYARFCLEVRRMIYDGRMHGAVSGLYIVAAACAFKDGRDLITYTFNESAISVIAAGGQYEGVRDTHGGDTRKGRKNITLGISKHRWRWSCPA